MLLLILGLSIIGIIIGCLVYHFSCDEDTAIPIWVIFGFIAVAAAIALAVVGAAYSATKIIDDKILLYQEENASIEKSIEEVVKSYMKYEAETFESAKNENIIACVTMYPELKSDALVSKQIDIYLSNNTNIKTLKTQKLQARVLAWWLFFGNK